MMRELTGTSTSEAMPAAINIVGSPATPIVERNSASRVALAATCWAMSVAANTVAGQTASSSRDALDIGGHYAALRARARRIGILGRFLPDQRVPMHRLERQPL